MFDVIGMSSMIVFTVFIIMAFVSRRKKNEKSKTYFKLAGVFFIIMAVSAVIAGPKEDNDKKQEKEVKKETIVKEDKNKEKDEEKLVKQDKDSVSIENIKPKDKESISEKKETKTFISKEEFNKKYKFDPEEKQYENGLFQFKDGSKVNADYLSYEDDGLFTYAMAIFYEGKMMKIQMETKKSPEEIEKILGLDFEKIGAKVEQNPHGWEIFFNKKFHDSNIKIYPFEWE